MKVILASKSPRRRELLSELFEKFDIKTADVDESLPAGLEIAKAVEILAKRKGAPIAEVEGDALVISSDTLVELDGVALGKPKNEEEASEMLRSLSARSHNVHTGIAVSYKGRVFSSTATSSVYFKELSDAEIDEYVKSGEPMDKAGAYGIQGAAGKFVSKYEGDFDTIVGLSLRLTKKLVNDALSGEFEK